MDRFITCTSETHFSLAFEGELRIQVQVFGSITCPLVQLLRASGRFAFSARAMYFLCLPLRAIMQTV
jgi:hypothetical protein